MKLTKRILALLGVFAIVAAIIITLVSAFFATEQSNQFFLAGLFCAISIPVMIYAYLLIYKLVRRKEEPMDDTLNESPQRNDNDEDSQV